MRSTTKILSVGGSIINPKTGFDVLYLKKLKRLFIDEVKKGNKFVLIVGGGSTARNYQAVARELGGWSNTDLDWLGIAATKMNAEFIRLYLGDLAYKHIITDPRNKVRTTSPVVIASGWKPGWSTDYVAVKLAETYGAKDIVNLSNIAYVYDKDPHTHADAQKIERIDWQSFQKEIVGDVWEPGKHVPLDPMATKHAARLKLRVAMVDGNNLTEVKKAIAGKTFKGTVIE